MKPLFHGCATALYTPFKKGAVDYPALEKLLDFQLSHGIDALVACGTTGEPSTLTYEEWEQVLSFTVRFAHGRVPVIAGTGGNNTAQVIQLAQRARELGADAQLCVTPYYNKTTQEGLIAHYTAIARDGSLPVIIYNVPSRTGLNVLPATLAVLAKDENIIAMKEASANVIQIMDMMRLCGDDIDFYSGSDELTAPLMAIGAQGTISVLSNIAPAVMHDMTHGSVSESAALNKRMLPLINALFSQVSPIPIKAAAAMMGLCENELRLPLVPMEASKMETLKKEMQKAGLIC